MDLQPQTSQTFSDDQELAEVLAGVTKNNDGNLDFEETPFTISAPEPTVTPEAEETQPTEPVEEPYVPPVSQVIQVPVTISTDLEGIKKDALRELRPLVEKLDLSAEEKFDIYLLLLRSTDDTTLIAQAHATAQQIEDESKRAQALLDVIKEIDFLSTPAATNL